VGAWIDGCVRGERAERKGMNRLVRKLAVRYKRQGTPRTDKWADTQSGGFQQKWNCSLHSAAKCAGRLARAQRRLTVPVGAAFCGEKGQGQQSTFGPQFHRGQRHD
jgi:hypothetical protein